jgi:hypothetical protein
MARITRALGKKREKREETKQMSLRVPTDISDLFDRYAEEDEVSVTQIGLDAFQQYIDQRNRETRLIEATVDETYELIANGDFDNVLMARLGVILEKNDVIAQIVTRRVQDALGADLVARQASVSDEQVAAIADRVAAMLRPAPEAEEPTPAADQKRSSQKPSGKPAQQTVTEREPPTTQASTRLQRPDEMIAISEDDLAAAGVSIDELDQPADDEVRAAPRRSTGKGTSRSSAKVSS